MRRSVLFVGVLLLLMFLCAESRASVPLVVTLGVDQVKSEGRADTLEAAILRALEGLRPRFPQGVTLGDVTYLKVDGRPLSEQEWFGFLEWQFQHFMKRTHMRRLIVFELPLQETLMWNGRSTETGFGFCSLREVSMPRLMFLGSNIFRGCASLQRVDIPSLREAGNGAFARCAALKSVSFPKLVSCGTYAFGECSSLKSVSFPKLVSCGPYAFGECTSLESVSLPALVSCDSGAFIGCRSLDAVFLPKLKSVGHSAFQGCTSLVSLDFPEVRTVRPYAFKGCFSLRTIRLSRAEDVGAGAFAYAESLVSADLPAVRHVGSGCFWSCTSLGALALPKAERVGEGAFRGARSLREARLPLVREVGSYAFYDMPSLRRLELYPPVTVGESVLGGSSRRLPPLALSLGGVSADAAVWLSSSPRLPLDKPLKPLAPVETSKHNSTFWNSSVAEGFMDLYYFEMGKICGSPSSYIRSWGPERDTSLEFLLEGGGYLNDEDKKNYFYLTRGLVAYAQLFRLNAELHCYSELSSLSPDMWMLRNDARGVRFRGAHPAPLRRGVPFPTVERLLELDRVTGGYMVFCNPDIESYRLRGVHPFMQNFWRFGFVERGDVWYLRVSLEDFPEPACRLIPDVRLNEKTYRINHFRERALRGHPMGTILGGIDPERPFYFTDRVFYLRISPREDGRYP